MKKSRRGFTLIELLIVVMIIGVLSASMTLVNNKATSSAKTSTIVANLKTMKSAAMLYYMDHIYSKDSEMIATSLTETSPDYLGIAAKGMIGYGYAVIGGTGTNATPKKWYVYYNLGHADIQGDPDIPDIKKKLAAQAKVAGLLDGANITAAPTTFFTGGTNSKFVLLQVR